MVDSNPNRFSVVTEDKPELVQLTKSDSVDFNPPSPPPPSAGILGYLDGLSMPKTRQVEEEVLIPSVDTAFTNINTGSESCNTNGACDDTQSTPQTLKAKLSSTSLPRRQRKKTSNLHRTQSYLLAASPLVLKPTATTKSLTSTPIKTRGERTSHFDGNHSDDNDDDVTTHGRLSPIKLPTPFTQAMQQRNIMLQGMPTVDPHVFNTHPSHIASVPAKFQPIQGQVGSSDSSVGSLELDVSTEFKHPRRRFSHGSPFLDAVDYRVLRKRSASVSMSDNDSVSSSSEPQRIQSNLSVSSSGEKKKQFLGDWPEVIDTNDGSDVDAPKTSDVDVATTPFSFLGVHAALAFFSVIGFLIRDVLGSFADKTMFAPQSVLYSTLVGCTIYGAVSRRQVSIEKTSYALYVGLTTGLCGSITSFGSWMLDANYALVNWPSAILEPYDDYASQIIGMLTILFVGLACAKGGLAFGQTLALVWTNQWNVDLEVMQACEPALRRPHGKDVGATLAAVVLIGVTVSAFGANDDPRRAMGCASAPFGTFLRYQLAKRLDGRRWNWLPRGTLAANFLGSVLLAGLKIWVDQGTSSHLTDELLSGVGLGFFGCFTTISTFILELDKMATWPRRALVYGFISLTGVQLLLLFINGVYLGYR
eukprot:m.70749 g.70749  ORF g.70749 m.70749 type:complete len:646 (-) comp24271_c0_seq2:38-1975(-)